MLLIKHIIILVKTSSNYIKSINIMIINHILTSNLHILNVMRRHRVFSIISGLTLQKSQTKIIMHHDKHKNCLVRKTQTFP